MPNISSTYFPAQVTICRMTATAKAGFERGLFLCDVGEVGCHAGKDCQGTEAAHSPLYDEPCRA